MSEPSAREIAVCVRAGTPVATRYVAQFKREWRRIPDQFESVANEALVRAAKVYDPNRDVPFPVFARPYVVGALHDYVRAEARETDQEVLAARAASLLGLGADVKPRLDSAAFNDTPAEARTRAARERRLRVQRMAAAALMVGDAPIDPEEQLLDLEEIKHAVDTMDEVMASTPPEQRDVFRLHAIQRKEQQEVATLLGISVRSVQRYLAEFERRMKQGLVDAGIELGANVERAWFHFIKSVGEPGG